MGKIREADAKEAEERKKKDNSDHHMTDGKPGVKMNDRSCTDILVCLLFVFMMAVMLGITAFSF